MLSSKLYSERELMNIPGIYFDSGNRDDAFDVFISCHDGSIHRFGEWAHVEGIYAMLRDTNCKIDDPGAWLSSNRKFHRWEGEMPICH